MRRHILLGASIASLILAAFAGCNEDINRRIGEPSHAVSSGNDGSSAQLDLQAPAASVIPSTSPTPTPHPQTFPQCNAAYSFRDWQVLSATCYIVNAAIAGSIDGSVAGSALPADGTNSTTKPGLHENILCRATFKNGTTGATETKDFIFGYGGFNDNYSGDNLGGHGIDGTKQLTPENFWGTIDALCKKQTAVDTAISTNQVCYSVAGSSYGGRFCSNLGNIVTCQWGKVGVPSFNCRTVADVMWGSVPDAQTNPVPNEIVPAPTPVTPTPHCFCRVFCSWYSVHSQGVEVWGVTQDQCTHTSDALKSAEFQACNGTPYSTKECTWLAR